VGLEFEGKFLIPAGPFSRSVGGPMVARIKREAIGMSFDTTTDISPGAHTHIFEVEIAPIATRCGATIACGVSARKQLSRTKSKS